MGTQISKTQISKTHISLIIIGCVLLFYWVGIGVYISESKKSTSSPTIPPEFTSTPIISLPPEFTNSPTIRPTIQPTIRPTIQPTPSPMPHLEFDSSGPAGPPDAPANFYRLGCQAALAEGLFPFSNFNTTGEYHSGVLCNYYKYDTWGYGGDTEQLNCGGNCTSGIKINCSDASPPISPNQPWSDEQCDICATASKDPNCIWTGGSGSCYETLGRVDYVDGKWVSNNITFVPTYHGMDISQCYYKSLGNYNDNKLCCDPSVK